MDTTNLNEPTFHDYQSLIRQLPLLLRCFSCYKLLICKIKPECLCDIMFLTLKYHGTDMTVMSHDNIRREKGCTFLHVAVNVTLLALNKGLYNMNNYIYSSG